ncbi:Arginyl-tRNA--protein transferase 1-like protein [Leptotrombidium deliense]|uniref:Arginyl-tRNA--protein transferase 1 n=1 Tax=Leptotrombidium deliense TaxID=299467 RepID=A0A443SE77_9ACAR|nr:Arginyl-tRNA--protein transferase 1-like protein [Leptotrombidium deliense]
MNSNRGIVEYFGSSFASDYCGYCKGKKPSGVDSGKCRAGVWAHFLTANNYQLMIDRGWRRSGKYCYKPDLKKSCCPPYTIKCDVLNFKLSKSQKKILNNVYRFLVFGDKRNIASTNNPTARAIQSDTTTVPKSECVSGRRLSDCDMKAIKSDGSRGQKAKYLRFQHSVKKTMDKQQCDRETALILVKERREKRNINRREKPLKDRINFTLPAKSAHKLDVRFVSTMNDEYQKDVDVSHKVYEMYQRTIHGDKPEECAKKQFCRFLINTPLEKEEFVVNVNGKSESYFPTSYGSYHMQYWLDDELIAVGVIDILPKCVSSVYFYYNPNYEFLSLGTYSALREIQLVQSLNTVNEQIQEYYMGFYIHSCPKMRYKRKYFPSFLLCPETFTWIPAEHCISLLDKNEYNRLQSDQSVTDEDINGIGDEDILILFDNQLVTYSVYKLMTGSEDQAEVYEFAKLMGKNCVSNVLLYRSN